MNLYQEITQYKEKNEELQKLKDKLKNYIEKNFISIPVKIERIEVGYDDGEGEEKVFNYPFLKVPVGFVKQKESTYRQFENCLVHEYSLVKSKLEIHIIESLKVSLINTHAAESYCIDYTVTVNGETFYFDRIINVLAIMKEKCS